MHSVGGERVICRPTAARPLGPFKTGFHSLPPARYAPVKRCALYECGLWQQMDDAVPGHVLVPQQLISIRLRQAMRW